MFRYLFCMTLMSASKKLQFIILQSMMFVLFIMYHCNGTSFLVFIIYHCNGMGYVLAISFLLQQLSVTSQILSICFCNALRGACKK